MEEGGETKGKGTETREGDKVVDSRKGNYEGEKRERGPLRDAWRWRWKEGGCCAGGKALGEFSFFFFSVCAAAP